MTFWGGVPGVRTTRREWVSDHASCDRLACRPILSGLLCNDHTRDMLLILMAEGLTPWGSFADCFQLGLGIGCVVVGVVGMYL